MATRSPALPSLDEVLRRQTRPPVCLYNYYIVLRDRLEMEILLDFWLDVQQARVLYRRQKKKNTIISTSTVISSLDIVTNSSQCTQQSNMAEVLERIYLRYIVPNAEKELLQLPKAVRENIGKHFGDDDEKKSKLVDPDTVFGEAQRYIHRILLESTFPAFLRYKTTMNLTLPQQVGRIGCGLGFLLLGFSLEFSFIFLNVQPWQQRIWGVLPIGLGIFLLTSGVTGLDPIWVLVFNVSETTTFHFNRIHDQEAKRMLYRRSRRLLVACLLITVVLLVFFCALPGKRL